MNDAQFLKIKDHPWPDTKAVTSAKWKCGYCNRDAGSGTGYMNNIGTGEPAYIRLCSYCNGPTFFDPQGDYVPGALPGAPVDHVPAELGTLFHEARAAAGASAHTAAVMACRKMLMHIAADAGGGPGKSFLDYVNYLADNGYVPPNGGTWVEYIRKRGNYANHEIVLMTVEDSRVLITFVEMLLRFIYEMPNLVPAPPPAAP